MYHHSKKQLLILKLFGFALICNAVCFSIQAPFYPLEAAKKGIPPLFYGLVFGVYEAFLFIFSLAYKILIKKMDPRLVNYMGIFTCGASYILYSFLSRMNRTTYFIAYSFSIRIVEASGFAAFYVSMHNIIRNNFRYDDNIILALIHISVGIGITFGPFLGGMLYELSGFICLYTVSGSFLIVSGILMWKCLPNINEEVDITKNCYNIFSFFKLPLIFLGSSAAFAANFSTGYLQATLVFSLQPVSLRPVLIGLLFSTNAVAYSLSSPLWGIVCRKWIPHQIVWLIGMLLILMGLSLIGPAPFIPMEASFVPCIIGLTFHGLGVGAEITASVPTLKQNFIAMEYPDDVITKWIIDDIITSSLTLGSFTGTVVSGLLYDVIGFRWISQLIVGFQIFLFLLTTIYTYFFQPKVIAMIQESKNADEAAEKEAVTKKTSSYKTFKSSKLFKALKPKIKKNNETKT